MMDDDEQQQGEEEENEIMEIDFFGMPAAVAGGQFEAFLNHGFTPSQAIYLVASTRGAELIAPPN